MIATLTPSPTHTSEVPLVPQTDPSPTHTSEVPVEPQTDPSPRPSPSTTIPDSIPESSGGNLGERGCLRCGEEQEDVVDEEKENDERCTLLLKMYFKDCQQKVNNDRRKLFQEIDTKDKGKKKIEEEDESESESDGILEAEKKFKQLASDEEMARKIQEEWEGKEEIKRLAEEEATNDALIRNYDDIKARIEADRLLAEKLQEEEREQFTIEERAKFLHDTIAAQRKFTLLTQRSGSYQEQTHLQRIN
ncbi:hypothetical protein Tco_1402422 [Tanacetum coccineum]